MTAVSRFFLLACVVFSCFFFSSIQGRHNGHTKRKHFHSSNHISLQPAPAPIPQAASPSYDSDAPSPSPGLSPSGIFNVLSFGAIGDGVTDDTQAFKMAWDTACQNEPSVILAPVGYSFLIQPTIFTGPCKRGLVFQIDGTIMPPDGPESWPRNTSKRQWLVFYRIKQLTMQGGGVIDGRGHKWWNLPCKPHKGINGTTSPGPCDSPVALRFFMSSNLTVQGLKVTNSPQFHFRFDNCQNVHVETLNIRSPASSPNTDGIHIENTNNVQIYNSLVSSGNCQVLFSFCKQASLSAAINAPLILSPGDDCISIGAGSHNVDINNVTCGPSHGISIGSLGIHNSRACVSNITVTDSTIRHSDNGVRIKTWQGGYGMVSKITFHNIRMEAVRNPIIIDQYYCLTKNCSNQTSAVFISDVSYTNIKGTYDVRSPPLHLACSDSVPCTNLVLSDIELLPAQGQMVANPFCWNAYGAMQTLTTPPVFCLLGGIPDLMGQNSIDQC